jgi:hypothetical protein
MDSTHIRWLEESLEKNTVQKIFSRNTIQTQKIPNKYKYTVQHKYEYNQSV